MLKLSSTQKREVEIYLPNDKNGTRKVSVPVIYRILPRDEWIERQGALLDDGDAETDSDDGAASISTRLRALNDRVKQLMTDVLVGVPEGTKIETDDGVIEDPDQVLEALMTNPFTCKGIYDHYSRMMNGEGARKN